MLNTAGFTKSEKALEKRSGAPSNRMLNVRRFKSGL